MELILQIAAGVLLAVSAPFLLIAAYAVCVAPILMLERAFGRKS